MPSADTCAPLLVGIGGGNIAGQHRENTWTMLLMLPPLPPCTSCTARGFGAHLASLSLCRRRRGATHACSAKRSEGRTARQPRTSPPGSPNNQSGEQNLYTVWKRDSGRQDEGSKQHRGEHRNKSRGQQETELSLADRSVKGPAKQVRFLLASCAVRVRPGGAMKNELCRQVRRSGAYQGGATGTAAGGVE